MVLLLLSLLFAVEAGKQRRSVEVTGSLGLVDQDPGGLILSCTAWISWETLGKLFNLSLFVCKAGTLRSPTSQLCCGDYIVNHFVESLPTCL